MEINYGKFSSIPWLREGIMFLARHGSHAYGTNLPASDLDVKGIAVPPPPYFLGFHNRFEQAESHDDPDLVVYDVRKFFSLAADCNPNIVEVLFSDPSDWLVSTKGFTEGLLPHRDLFLSRKAKHTFSGYAVSQLKRIKTHRRWLLKPPGHEPTREEFRLTGSRPTSKEQLGAAKAAILRELDLQGGEPPLDQQATAARKLGYDENFIEYLQREQAYSTAKREWDQFQTWKLERNKVRAELEARHGYDTKHAMHLVRLLRMCREILEGKGVIVRRPDAAELLEVRAGKWSYDQVVEFAEREDLEQERLMAESKLPHGPDRPRLDSICVELVERWHSKK